VKATKKKTQRVQRKVPGRLIPIVDAVVEMVFARLKDAAAKAKAPRPKRSSARSKGDQVHPSAENRDGLAGAVADLILAGLTHPPEPTTKRKKRKEKRPRKRIA
jgi:hypothetical protein